MPSYIAVQHTYTTFEIALFHDNQCIEQLHESKQHTSALFIPLLDQLLKKHNLTLADISFCAVNAGPGPFSTLRSILASVNGLYAAIKLPLIGIDGLHATFLEFYNPQYQHTIVLLNAFNNEVYYLIADGKTITATGYENSDTFLAIIKKQLPNIGINFIGNGATLYAANIYSQLPQATVTDHTEMCSVITIARLGLEKFQEKKYHAGPIMPLHLKKHAVER